MGVNLIRGAGKLLRMPANYAAMRGAAEVRRNFLRKPRGYWETKFTDERIAKALEIPSLVTRYPVWENLALLGKGNDVSRELLIDHAPEEIERVLGAANEVMKGQVSLLGSGLLILSDPIDWQKDMKSNLSWEFAHFSKIDTHDLDRPSDIKFPWELSRMQWLIPVVQAWQVTGDDRYARKVRDVLEGWWIGNPTEWGVNWACTMEPAMRIISWIWFFQILGSSPSWSDERFRFRFIQSVFLHTFFVRRNLELSDVNGNHLIADALGLAVGGAFLGSGVGLKWAAVGQRILVREISEQVFPDGVDFEASLPYHRFVTECWYLAAVVIEDSGGKVPEHYRERLIKMGDFVRSYLKPDGMAPVIGDADDSRVLPFGGQTINDHRYLPYLIFQRWAPTRNDTGWSDSASECLWWWGGAPQQKLRSPEMPLSRAFPEGGFYIMRSRQDYAILDCGDIGLGGRGGHGHNDILSFELVLSGQTLFVDSGSYVYTADYGAMKQFRSTASHNAIRVNREEVNRFVSERMLWSMYFDAIPRLLVWEDDSEWIKFQGMHTGYQRLNPPTTVRRSFIMSKQMNAVAWEDTVEPTEGQEVEAFLHLAVGVDVAEQANNMVQLFAGEDSFVLEWEDCENWSFSIEDCLISPSYGVTRKSKRFHWKTSNNSVVVLRLFCYRSQHSNKEVKGALNANLKQVRTQAVGGEKSST